MKTVDFALLRKMLVIAVILLLLVSMLNAVGTAYGRYITVVSAESDMNIEPKPAPYVLGGEVWVTEPLPSGIEKHKTEFTLTNCLVTTVDETSVETVEDRDLSVTVRIFVSTSDYGNKVHARLVYDEEELVGVPEKVDANSFIGKTYGEGVIFKFFDSEGRELVWDMPGEIKTEYGFAASVTGADLFDENGEVNYNIIVERFFTN